MWFHGWPIWIVSELRIFWIQQIRAIQFQEKMKHNTSLFRKKMHQHIPSVLNRFISKTAFEFLTNRMNLFLYFWCSYESQEAFWFIVSNCLHFFDADMNYNPFFFFSDIVYEPLFIRVNACVIIVAQSILNEENVRCINSLSETSDHTRVHKGMKSDIEINHFKTCLVVPISWFSTYHKELS